jgi:lysine biosynthesis protein LysW
MTTCLCPECGADIEITDDIMEDEVVVCPECGQELEYKNNELIHIPLVDGEDWGE